MNAKVILISGLVTALLLTSCTTLGPEYSRPDTSDFLENAQLESDYATAEPVLQNWWDLFGDARLSKLVDQSLENNRDLIALQANLQASRANLALARIDQYPSDNISTSASRARQSAAALGLTNKLPTTDAYSVSFAPQWDIDLFGSLARQVEIARSDFAGLEAQLHDLQLIVIGEVASQYFQLQSLLVEKKTFESNIALQTESLKLSEAQLVFGRGTEINVLNARSQLRSTQAQVPQILASISIIESRLAILTGHPPGSLSELLAKPSLVTYMDTPLPIGELSTLIRRQPSIRIAEHKLAGAVSSEGLAISSMFPQVSIVGSFGYSAQQSGDLFDSNALQFSFGPTLSWSLSNLIRGKQLISAAKSRSDAAFAEYENSVLAALEDLNAALANQKSARDRQPLLIEARLDAEEAERISKVQYQYGATSFSELLDAQQQLLLLQLSVDQGTYDIIAAQIATFRALGAG